MGRVDDRPVELARLLRDTWAAVEAAMLAGVDAEVRPAHLPVLRVVNARGPSRISAIAREVGVSRQAVAQTVAPLVDAGVLEVAADPSDGRAKLLRYTPSGERVYAQSLRVYEAIEAAYAERAGARRAASLRTELAELRAVAEAVRARGG
jgi:DNA-binding MarR family transcriptional regulator